MFKFWSQLCFSVGLKASVESVDRRVFKIYFICIPKKGPTDSDTAGFETGGPTASCLSLGDPTSSLNLSCLLCTMG